MDWLEERLAKLPTEPGVYLMKDRHGDVIYVGKAVNLKSRVRSYFNRTGDTRAFIPLLDSLLGDIETVVVTNEKEALLLENELIKRHKPRFNVQLRDDKNFICLRLDPRPDYPRLEVVRSFKNDGARYFGPYASASSIRETLRTINRYFQLRTCTDHVLHNRKRPCLLFQIGRCPAPCVNPIPREAYHRNVEAVTLFLEGKASALVEDLRVRIKQAAGELRFEDAARLRDQLFAIERSLERQRVAVTEAVDQDVFAYHREGERLLFYVLYIRKGRISGGQAFPFTGQEFPTEELLASFASLYYDHENLIPDQVLLPLELDGGTDAFEQVLSERKGQRVRVRIPKRGDRHELIALAKKNAEQAALDRSRTREENEAILARLQTRLHLSKLPWRMECYDISHFQGAAIVASQVAVTGGEVDKARYRRFKIKSITRQDDFASMHEVLTRRLKAGLSDGDLPDLIVIDGGKGQLASAHAALRDLGIEGVDMVGLAKSRDEDTPQDRTAKTQRSPERVFLLHRKDPIVLAQNSAELFMLTRMRDEAHRFAITFQQNLMRRRNFRSILEDIPGVAEGRKKSLLKAFGSLKRVREATIEQLTDVVGPTLAERIHGYLHGEPPDLEEEEVVRESSLEDAVASAPANSTHPSG